MRNRFLLFCILLGLTVTGVKSGENENVPMKPALLIIDMQNQYLPYMDDKHQEFAMQMINGAIQLFRQYNFPVIRIYHTDPEWGPPVDSEGFMFHKTLQVKEGDPRIIKHHMSGFQNTNLEQLLRDKGCNTVFLCGLSATACVLATHYGAVERDFKAFMIKGAILSGRTEHTDMIEDITDAVGWQALETFLNHINP
ncbi:cysteine hydrolase [bacterium]|nr:cysteine hydrolase [bacterium]